MFLLGEHTGVYIDRLTYQLYTSVYLCFLKSCELILFNE